jgi:glutamate formiminotransferase/formiminotetrahydrofolate cyclodeaminase
METALKSYKILAAMAEKGNPASISDVGVGLLATRAGLDGAAMNVRINLAGLKDEQLKSALQEKVRKIGAESEFQFKTIIQIVESKMS